MWIITALPREILQHIFAFIPATDLAANTSRVSKLFYELGDDSVFWKRKCVREFRVGITGNVYPPNDWRKEYLVMSSDWDLLTGNLLRRDAKYTNMANIDIDEKSSSIIFANVRPREGVTNLAPITVQSVGPLRPLPLGDFSVGYFEIKLLAGGEEQMIGLGLARNDYLDAMPGWKKGSIGYHGDDGRVFIGCGYGRSLTEPWGEGEIFGCGVDFRRRYVFFTKNGVLLGTFPLRRAEGLYPTIGSRTQGETVSVNFGKSSFCFDIIQYQLGMADQSPRARPGQFAVPYSKLVYSCKPLSAYSQVPYDAEDDVEDEDNEFDDKGMNKASQYFNSVLRVLMNSDDYPNDDGSVESLVTVLRHQMVETGVTLPNMEIAELRNALSNQIQFNKQSALLAYFLRVYEEGVKPPLADTVLPRDEFPKVEIIKCIATLLIDEYRDDHPLVLNTINRGRMLFNFQPPPGMTIMQERGQLSLVLSREIQAHERERRTKRREIFKNLRVNEPTFYYYNENSVKDYSILLGNLDEIPPNTSISPSSNININNTTNNNNNNNNNEDNENVLNDDIQASFQTILDELMGGNDDGDSNINNNNNNNANNNNNTTVVTTNNNNNNNINNDDNNTGNEEEQQQHPTLSPQQFQDMLKSYVDLLDDRTIPDEDPRITGAICQWYTTLDIEMKPEMQISIERNRLIKVLSHLRTKVDEHIEDHNATSFISRAGLRFKRYCRNVFKRDNTMKLSLFVMIGLFVARSVQKRKP